MTKPECRINYCQERARWTVTIKGHPNSNHPPADYCTKHAGEKAGTLWEDSPKQYSVTVEGPFGV